MTRITYYNGRKWEVYHYLTKRTNRGQVLAFRVSAWLDPLEFAAWSHRSLRRVT